MYYNKNHNIAVAAHNYVQKVILESSSRISSNSQAPEKRLKLQHDIDSLREKDNTIGVSNDGIVRYFNTCLKYIEEAKKGNCEEMALLILGYMQKNHPEINTELFYISGYNHYKGSIHKIDHIVAVIGRDMDSDINDPMTWGDSAFFCDGYQESLNNGVFLAKTYKDNLKGMISIDDENATRIALKSGKFGKCDFDLDSEDFIYDIQEKNIVSENVIISVDWEKSIANIKPKIKPFVISTPSKNTIQLNSMYFNKFKSENKIKELKELYSKKLLSLLELLKTNKDALLEYSNRLKNSKADEKYNLFKKKMEKIERCWGQINKELSLLKKNNNNNQNSSYIQLEKEMLSKIDSYRKEINSALNLNENQKKILSTFRIKRCSFWQPDEPRSQTDFRTVSDNLSKGCYNIMRK